jgi:4-hydroxybenzoate polyprenyltransferase
VRIREAHRCTRALMRIQREEKGTGRRRKRGRKGQRTTVKKRRNRKHGRVRTYFIQLSLPCSLLRSALLSICLHEIYTQLFLFNGLLVLLYSPYRPHLTFPPAFSSSLYLLRVLLSYITRPSNVSPAFLECLSRTSPSLPSFAPSEQ